MPHLTASQWALGILCAILTGKAKTGLPGLGILVVPLMVLTAGDAKLAAGWLLPMLCTADVVAVTMWRRHAAAARLFSLAPWVLAGTAVGAVSLAMPEAILRRLVAAIVLLMLAAYLWRRYGPGTVEDKGAAAPYGLLAGFATTVANAAGPVMSLYLLRKRLTKEEFVATGAWFFFAINLVKVPIYLYHGMINLPSLEFDAAMAPAVVLGAFSGRWLVDRISARVFEALVLLLTAVSTLLLFR
jgi:uncharacterized membrane protein YfcA